MSFWDVSEQRDGAAGRVVVRGPYPALATVSGGAEFSVSYGGDVPPTEFCVGGTRYRKVEDAEEDG